MRESGILLPITSLPSAYGIGCLDRAACEFIDQLQAAGQKVWQILPIGPTGYGDSPYQSFSTFAGNPYFISLEALIEAGWLTEEECEEALGGGDRRYVDYGRLYHRRLPLLKKAYGRSRIKEDPGFAAFCRENLWLQDYALFMAIKDAHGGAAWDSWEEELRMRKPEALRAAEVKYAEDVTYYCFLQYLFYSQMDALLDYAHTKGVRILGDIPIYVSFDSADTWANPELFMLNERKVPLAVAGCPPDAFAADGQLWGNPLYRWEYHAQTGYEWWIRRVRQCFRTCDILRIDHFRGFDEYYSIPYGDVNARRGHWEKGPGIALFRAIKAELGEDIQVVAEDLGYVTDSVRQMVCDSGFPGMKLFQFAFDSRDTGSAADYLPHNYTENAVAYTGTHDNATLLAWMDEILPEELEMVRAYICCQGGKNDLIWPEICTVLRSVSRLAVIPMQDYLGYGNEARMNKPSTQGGNWQWRLLPGEFTRELQEKIKKAVTLYGR